MTTIWVLYITVLGSMGGALQPLYVADYPTHKDCAEVGQRWAADRQGGMERVYSCRMERKL